VLKDSVELEVNKTTKKGWSVQYLFYGKENFFLAGPKQEILRGQYTNTLI